MRHHLKTRILLANGGHARWVERDGEKFVTIAELEAERETAHHATTTVHQSGGPVRHGAGEVDLAKKGRTHFAADIAKRLDDEARSGAFERLAIVAPPAMLHALREELSPATLAKLVHELPKDLMKTPTSELGDWLSSVKFG